MKIKWSGLTPWHNRRVGMGWLLRLQTMFICHVKAGGACSPPYHTVWVGPFKVTW